MRRKVFAVVAVLALAICSVAYAAGGFDKGSGSIVAKAKGSAKKPAVTGITQNLQIKNAQGGKYAYPATNIKVTIGGLKVENQSKYPTCTPSQLNANPNSCSSKAMIASGTVKAELWKGSTGQPCTVPLKVYNGGNKKTTWFLDLGTSGDSKCVNLTDSAVPAWTSKFSEHGKSLVLNIPIPKQASTDAGGLNLWAAIENEKLTWKKVKTHGPLIVSTGCTANKRSWSYVITASNGSSKKTNKISGKSAC